MNVQIWLAEEALADQTNSIETVTCPLARVCISSTNRAESSRGKQTRRREWSYFYLYVIIDIFSRRVVGWCVADRESATLFNALFDDATTKNPAPKGQLTLHADRGGPMRAKATALLLADLGVTKSHSRPHTSNDNPFSESHFKTMKYQPQFPPRFGSSGRQNILPQLLRLVQSGPSPCRHRPDDARPGALRSGRRRPRRPSDHTRRRLQQKPRTLRHKAARTACKAHRDLDQSADQPDNGPSLNTELDCLNIVDTFRHAGAEDDRGSLVASFRALVHSVTIHPNGPREGFEIEVNGKLATLIGGEVFPQAIRSGGYMVAGERFTRSPPSI
jgi:transposase InsO family protein